MPENDQNKDLRNQDFYGTPNPGGSARNNGFGQVQPGIPPYGEPRAYDTPRQPYQPQQVYPAYNNPQPAPPQMNDPYAGNSAPGKNIPPFPGYSGLKPPPQNSAPAKTPVVNPYSTNSKKMYSSSAYNEGDTVYEAFNSGKRSKRIIFIVSIILLAAAVGAAVFFLFFKGKSSSSSSDNKRSTTEATNYAIVTESEQPSTEKATEDPDAGLIVVPDVVGENMRIAKVRLEELGLRVKFSQTYSILVDADHIIDQNIPAESKVPLDTEITLTVSMGPEPEKKVEVPSVKDLTYTEASDKLIDLGFSVDLEFLNSKSVPKDKVISQSIPSGTQTSKGSKITLTVSKGAEAPTVRTGIVTTKETALNIRKAPDTDAEIIGGADKGEKIAVIGEEGDWYIVKYKDITGYAAKEYIRLT